MTDGHVTASNDIQEFVSELNASWLQSRWEDLDRYLHPDMVISMPGFTGRVEGKESGAQSYKDFASAASISRFDSSDFHIDVFESTAVVSYVFAIGYEMDGRAFDDTGRDFLVLVRSGSGWLVAWRTMFPVETT
jgi:hypothetical protein